MQYLPIHIKTGTEGRSCKAGLWHLPTGVRLELGIGLVGNFGNSSLYLQEANHTGELKHQDCGWARLDKAATFVNIRVGQV